MNLKKILNSAKWWGVREDKRPLYAIYMEREGEGQFITYASSESSKEVIRCSRNPQDLQGYINMNCIPFETKKTEYSLVDITSLINAKIISKKKLDNIEGKIFQRHYRDHAKRPLQKIPVPNPTFDKFSSRVN